MFGLTQTSHFWLYFAMVAGIIVLPGMDMAFVMASALVDGRKAGFAAVAGIVAGGVLHLTMGALGVGLILLSAPRLFNVLLLAGSAYVAWIGASLLRGATALAEIREERSRPLSSTFVRAVLTCLLNPKAYVFMLAVFPQFLRTEYGSIAAQAVVLGAITSLTQATVYGGVALGAAHLRGWLRRNAAAQRTLGRSVGVLLVLVATWAAWQGWQPGLTFAGTSIGRCPSRTIPPAAGSLSPSFVLAC
jgi:threonine/homoserine/homoserine lactone efflux protein